MSFEDGPYPVIQRSNYSDWPSQVVLYSGQPTVPLYSNNDKSSQQDLSALNQGSEIIMARYQADAERRDRVSRRNRPQINLGANLFGL